MERHYSPAPCPIRWPDQQSRRILWGLAMNETGKAERGGGVDSLHVFQKVVIMHGFTEFRLVDRVFSRVQGRPITIYDISWQIPHKHASVPARQSSKTRTIPASVPLCAPQSKPSARQSKVGTRQLQRKCSSRRFRQSTVSLTRILFTRTRLPVIIAGWPLL